MKRPLAFYSAFFFAALTRRMLSYLMIVYGFNVLGGAWSGLLYFCVFAPYLAFGLYAGVLVDRVSKRMSLLRGLGGTTFLFVVIAAASAGNWFGLSAQRGLILAAGTFLYGTSYAVIYPAFLATVPQFAARTAIGRATVAINVLSTIGLAYAPLLIGLLRQWLDWTALFGVLIASSALAFGLLAWSGVSAGETTRGEASDWESLKQLLAFSRRHRFLAQILVFATLFCLFMVGPLEVLLPNLLERVFHFAPLPAGLYIAIGGTGLVAGSILALTLLERGRAQLWLTVFAVLASIMMVLSVHASLPLLRALLLISGVCGGAFSSLAIAHAQSSAPDALRGRVMSLFALIMGGVPSLGGLGAGLLAEQGGVLFAVEAAFGTAAIVFLIVGLAASRPSSAEP